MVPELECCSLHRLRLLNSAELQRQLLDPGWPQFDVKFLGRACDFGVHYHCQQTPVLRRKGPSVHRGYPGFRIPSSPVCKKYLLHYWQIYVAFMHHF